MSELTIEALVQLHPIAQAVGVCGIIIIPCIFILAFWTEFFDNFGSRKCDCKCGDK